MSRSTLRLIIAMLTIITAAVHLFLGISGITSANPDMLSYIFVLNGLGFLVLLAGLLLPGIPVLSDQPTLTHWLFILFTGITFVLYFAFNGLSFGGPAAIVAKLAELLLIIFLFLHMGATE